MICWSHYICVAEISTNLDSSTKCTCYVWAYKNVILYLYFRFLLHFIQVTIPNLFKMMQLNSKCEESLKNGKTVKKPWTLLKYLKKWVFERIQLKTKAVQFFQCSSMDEEQANAFYELGVGPISNMVWGWGVTAKTLIGECSTSIIPTYWILLQADTKKTFILVSDLY